MRFGDLVLCSYAVLIREVQRAIEQPIAQALEAARLGIELANQKIQIAAETHLDNVRLRHALTLVLHDSKHIHNSFCADSCPIKIAETALRGETRQ